VLGASDVGDSGEASDAGDSGEAGRVTVDGAEYEDPGGHQHFR
jgi:hypothetical protein